MAIDSREKRRSCVDFAGIRGTGMPTAIGSIPEASRVHVLNLYTGILPSPSPFFFWRNRRIVSTVWTPKAVPLDSSTQTF